MAHPYQADHEGVALTELLSQFNSDAKPNINGLTVGLMGEVQVVEDNTLDLREDRLLSTAIGAQLDVFGRLVGEPRGDLTDDQYRRFIQARIMANLAEGTPDELLAIWTIIAGPKTTGTTADYTRMGVAAYMLNIVRDGLLTAAEIAKIQDFFDDISPAGVGYGLVVGNGTGDGPFRFDSGPGFDTGKLALLLQQDPPGL